jgi:hypothetical protein
MARGQIFLSYASERRDAAEPIALALRSRGYDVFFDRDDLPAGDTYHDQIAAAVERADIMVFALSPEAVDKGRYTVSEIGLARKKWKTPKGRVLPVMIAPTPMEEIPAYLKEVSLLDSHGNLVADTALRVDEMFEDLGKKERMRIARIAAPVAAGVILVGLAGWIVSSMFTDRPVPPPALTETAEAAPATPPPEGARTVRTPILGLQFVQDGEALPIYVTSDEMGYTDRSIVQIRRTGLEIRAPEQLWTTPDAQEPGLQVAMSADPAIFTHLVVGDDVKETPYFGTGTGMADTEFGSGTLFTTDSEHPDCCPGHNYVTGGRFNASGTGYRGFFVSQFLNPVNMQDVAAGASSVYLVFYMNRDDPAAWTDWEAADTLQFNEFEQVELRFVD